MHITVQIVSSEIFLDILCRYVFRSTKMHILFFLVVCRKFCLQIPDVYESICFLPILNDLGHSKFGSLPSHC